MTSPDPSKNIFPRTRNNIQAILEYYFPFETHSAIKEASKKLYEKRGVALNQLEFTAKFLSENHLEIKRMMVDKSLWGLLRDTRDALFNETQQWEVRNGTNTPKIEILKDWINSQPQT